LEVEIEMVNQYKQPNCTNSVQVITYTQLNASSCLLLCRWNLHVVVDLLTKTQHTAGRSVKVSATLSPVMITLHWFIIADTSTVQQWNVLCFLIFWDWYVKSTSVMKILPQIKRDSSFDHEFPKYFGQFQCTGAERRYDAEERVSSGSLLPIYIDTYLDFSFFFPF
jgi:hypothetical protein